MKKLITLLIAFLLVFTLVSCEKEKESESHTCKHVCPTCSKCMDPNCTDPVCKDKCQGHSDKPGETDFWDKDGNGTPDWQEKEINLTYATWQYNTSAGENDTIDTLMIKAFMAKYPNIHVEMQIVGEDYEWDTNMQALAETGDLPDVFLVYRLETALPYHLLADITDCYNNDPDTKYIFDSLKSAGTYGGKRYAVPSFFYPEYWFVNLDILTEKGIEAPEYDWTWDQMEAIASACYDESKHYAGQYGVAQYYRVLPKILSGNTSWQSYSFDGTKFNFDSEYVEQSFNKLATALQNDAVTNAYSQEEIESWFGAGVLPNYDGYSAIWCSPCWEAKGYFDTMNFNYDIYPAPGGTINGNIDIIGVSSTCEEKEAAYQLMKWMSFSEEGLVTRYTIYEQYSEVLFKSANNYPYPVVDYGINKRGENLVWDCIETAYTEKEGMHSYQMINAIRNCACWGNKEIPGWDAANKAVYDYIYQITTGADTFANLKATIIDLLNPTFNEFREKLNQILAGDLDIEDLFPVEEEPEESGEGEESGSETSETGSVQQGA